MWWARLGSNQRPLPCEGEAIRVARRFTDSRTLHLSYIDHTICFAAHTVRGRPFWVGPFLLVLSIPFPPFAQSFCVPTLGFGLKSLNSRRMNSVKAHVTHTVWVRAVSVRLALSEDGAAWDWLPAAFKRA